MAPTDAPHGSDPELPYRSEPLAVLLDVFARWSSGGFIEALTRSTGHDLDPTSVVALTHVARAGAMRPSTLAEHLFVGASNVSKISARLSALGLLEKVPDPDDARATLLRLTADGRTLMAELVRAGDDMMGALLADWTPADRDTFTHLLRRFETAVVDHADRLATP
jgi:DNA-binding MarR family transcriptional regulator